MELLLLEYSLSAVAELLAESVYLMYMMTQKGDPYIKMFSTLSRVRLMS